jgi:hypothetical protein
MPNLQKFCFYKALPICIMVMLSSSCEKEIQVRYEVSLDANFDIPSGLNTLETHYFIIRDVPTFYNLNASLKRQDTAAINQVIASRGLIRSRFNDVNFDFVERISIYAVSKKNPDLKREMYYLDFVPLNTGRELRMLSSTTALKEIIQEETMDVEIRMNVRNFTNTSIRATFDFGYAVL